MLTQQHEAERAALQSELDAQRQRELSQLEAAHQQERAAQQDQASQQLQALAAEHEAACQELWEEDARSLAAAHDAAEATHAAAIHKEGSCLAPCKHAGSRGLPGDGSRRVQAEEEHAAVLGQQQAEHDARMASARSAWDGQLRTADVAAREAVSQCEQRYQSMQTDLLASHAARVASMQSAHEAAISSMQEKHAVQVTPSPASTASKGLYFESY